MPQLDPSSFTSQLFWLTVSFVMLYLVLARFLLPRVQSVLAFRTHTLQKDIKQAERLKVEAEKVHQHYEHSMLEARTRSQKLLSDARETIATRAANSLAELDATLDEEMEQSQTAIESAKRAVMQKLTPVSQELTSLIVEMLVEYKPAARDVESAVAGITKERRL